MTPEQRANAKEVYRRYMLALDAHVHNIDDPLCYKEWNRAYGNWVYTMRIYGIGRFDRESIHEEVVAELASVL